jgi:hypothetical protein
MFGCVKLNGHRHRTPMTARDIARYGTGREVNEGRGMFSIGLDPMHQVEREN